ncbi:MAG: hypothetical protein Q4C75_00970, partial [Bergeyella zoohelcum]|nr:hypothetical protein [Bergeyella zoohelcum]
MNHLFSNKIIALAIMFFTLFSLQSCNRDDEPVAPINETKDKGHDEWGKVEIILYEGHLHGKEFHANPMYINGKVLPKKQILTITRDENGNLVRVRKNVLVEGEKDNYKEVEVLKDSDHPFETQTTVDEQGNSLNGARYAMEIVYYNKKGERMNHEFVTPEMRPIHQHFFTTKSYSDLFT